MKKIKKDIRRGLRQPDEENPFELFLSATDIRYAYYKESNRILGNTYGMCILQDFQALTPNLLARTIETVEGGGIIVLLLKTMSSLKQLCAMTMDVHSRFRTESHQDIIPRFNERFMLSLGTCSSCLVLDDELNILPISSHVRNIKKVVLGEDELDAKTDSIVTESQTELNELKIAMADTQPVGSLMSICRTLDQARAVLTCVEAISEKTLRATVVSTAARGRGKSAALGISVAGAVAYGYSNIFITAPSPENVKTLFEMILKGFDALDYTEHQDYEVVQSTNPEFNKAVVRINVFQEHRQTIQYIQPSDAALLAQAELVVIDEAAAIPLPLVKALMGNYLCFMSSTVNGYEGTGRSLSLKLVKQLRQQSAVAASNTQFESKASAKDTASGPAQSAGGRVLREIVLEEPIRYGVGDPCEKWLNDVLCLDCTKSVPRITGGVPHPSECELYQVERDTLFSYHKASEAFLHRMMSLFVSSHYKNSPNDLQMLSDAPAHMLFVLLGPVQPDAQEMPDILVAVQVALEGHISKQSVQRSMARGKRLAGDLIPWCISEQFQNSDFAMLSGARVVRIATHPDLGRMGYASRAMDLLTQFYEGKMVPLDNPIPKRPESKKRASASSSSSSSSSSSTLLNETLAPRTDLPPLLQALSDVSPPDLQYLGVSYGITMNLFNFWRKTGFVPVYLRQTSNSLTGEHTTIVIKALEGSALGTVANRNWLDSFQLDFTRRFVSLLGISFTHFSAALALSVMKDPKQTQPEEDRKFLTYEELHTHLSDFDLRRLEAYKNNLVDFHLILDLIPILARFFFLNRLDLSLSYTQGAILLATGLQHKTVTQLEKELTLGSAQILALFNKSIRKIVTFFRGLEENKVKTQLLQDKKITVSAKKNAPINTTLNQELNAGAREANIAMKEKQAELLSSMNLSKFAVMGSETEWDKALEVVDEEEGQEAPVPGKVTLASKGFSRQTHDKRDKRQRDSSSKKSHKKSKKART